MAPLHSTEMFGTSCHFTCPLLFCCVFVETKVSNRSGSRLEERNRDNFFFSQIRWLWLLAVWRNTEIEDYALMQQWHTAAKAIKYGICATGSDQSLSFLLSVLWLDHPRLVSSVWLPRDGCQVFTFTIKVYNVPVIWATISCWWHDLEPVVAQYMPQSEVPTPICVLEIYRHKY